MSIKTAVFGGGCFWCTEAIFRETKGVQDVISGFSGGKVRNPAYKEVCLGVTGHTEVVKVIYDELVISYEQLFMLHLFTHDPTQLPINDVDKARQYRSVIFYQNEEERLIAEDVLKKMETHFKAPVITDLLPFEVFYQAEDNHQNFYACNRDSYYAESVIEPKLDEYRKLKSSLFSDL